MSESEGLQKLTAYLNQTRRQAEAAIDNLNVQIEDLRKENDLYAQLCKKLEQEKDYFKSMSEQLKQGNTTKQMLQERDDWRALIDNVQKDRARLQEEVCALEVGLDSANEEIAKLRDEIEYLSAQPQNDRKEGSPTRTRTPSPTRLGGARISIQIGDESGEGSDGETSASPLVSPILDRNGREVELNLSGPPHQVIRRLQLELKRAYGQVITSVCSS
jgi:septal ring factor EnvC (AmiA/AmiB activator)